MLCTKYLNIELDSLFSPHKCVNPMPISFLCDVIFKLSTTFIGKIDIEYISVIETHRNTGEKAI